ncbi:centrosomal protein POC5 isoform X2 [Xenopus tropicalis]|uniref:Centrosomal protein POC5 n=1 Tax=Xenopus tropicalis TaxID=8364 RepID=A0A8J0QYZ4_XENTR|nr:centrosomal protein POC5 isoform X2 [Xenopus tropicalis]|eukprot:XP_004910451.1 PREDICTED: centrosomal protein POC5 isoform X2 [Xenopus tropicalis]
MSSDEEYRESPILPKDSDHGSSVSSDLQDEYDELLRYAVVTPRFGPHFLGQNQLITEQTRIDKVSSPKDPVQDQSPARNNSEENIPDCSAVSTSQRRSPSTANEEERVMSEKKSFLSGLEAFSPLHSEDLSLGGSTSSGSQVQQVRVKELPVPSENMDKVEDVLDLWSGTLKTNIMAELSKWRLTIIEQHKLEIKNQNEKHVEQISQLSNQIDKLQDLLQTYETSIQRKDEVISNLTHALEKHKEKTELMRTFTHWRLQLTEARQEDYSHSLADRHYKSTLMKNAWKAWRSVIESNWKDKIEQACRARAEEVCVELANDYESKLTQLNGALGEARAEVQRLLAERGQFEGSMKKAFMRGVCALNMEAMSMFQGRESRMEYDHPPRREERDPSPSVTFQNPPVGTTHPSTTSALHSPVTCEPNFIHAFGQSSVSQSKEDVNTPAVISSVTSASSALPTQKLPMTRVVTSCQQKAGKTITARITARSDLAQRSSKIGSNITSMAVNPPMSSIVVEKHHPVTQQTISQAAAAKYPRAALQSTGSIGGRSSGQSGRVSQTHAGIHSIKVVD